jgi:hypothetical protein
VCAGGPHRRPLVTVSPDSTSRLNQLLDQARPALEAALAEARRELETLNERRHELEAIVARATAALAAFDAEDPVALSHPSEHRTLHEAMKMVLKENSNRWMTVHELANEINDRGLYEKRDRTPVDPSQIHARARKYDWMFEKESGRIRLTASATD